MLSPADVAREGLTGWPPSHERHFPAGIQLPAEPLQHLRVAEITLLGAATEVMAMGGDRVWTDVAGQHYLESGAVEPQAQATCSAEQIHSKRRVFRKRTHVPGQFLETAAPRVGFENLLRPFEGLEAMFVVLNQTPHHQVDSLIRSSS
jgi:hypothetical protein